MMITPPGLRCLCMLHEQARIFQMLDDLAGDDCVELLSQIHRLDVGDLHVISLLVQNGRAFWVDINAQRLRVGLCDALMEEIGFVFKALLGVVAGLAESTQPRSITSPLRMYCSMIGKRSVIVCVNMR